MTDAPPAAAPRIEIVDALRGLAALSVAWFHITDGLEAPSLLKITGAYGWVGVDIFFVLSGFIIPYSMSRYPGGYALDRLPSFLARRIVRIELPYLASIALALGALWLAAQIPGSGWRAPDVWFGLIASHIFYLTPFTDYRWIQVIYWTLAFEFAFYILIGVFYPAVMRRGSKPLFAAVSVAICALVTALTPLSDAPDHTRRAVLFVMGLSVCRAHVCADEPRFTYLIIALAGLTMLSLGGALEAIVGAATSLLLMRLRTNARALANEGGALERLGAMSYSLYVTHFVIFSLCFAPLGGIVGNWPLNALAQCALTLALCLGCAYGFYVLIERPAQRLSKRIPSSRLTGFAPRVPSARRIAAD
ncbi:MAG: acyltransferase [Pseudomonadota bacterium]